MTSAAGGLCRGSGQQLGPGCVMEGVAHRASVRGREVSAVRAAPRCGITMTSDTPFRLELLAVTEVRVAERGSCRHEKNQDQSEQSCRQRPRPSRVDPHVRRRLPWTAVMCEPIQVV